MEILKKKQSNIINREGKSIIIMSNWSRATN